MSVGSYVMGDKSQENMDQYNVPNKNGMIRGDDVSRVYVGNEAYDKGLTMYDRIMNTPSNQKYEYERAGINPMLAGVSAGSSSGGFLNALSQLTGAGSSAGSMAASGMGVYQAVRTSNANIEQAQATADKTRKEAEGQDYINAVLKNNVEVSGSEVTKAQEEATQSQIKTKSDNLNQELTAIQLEIQQQTKENQIKLSKLQQDALNKQIAYVKAQTSQVYELNKKIKAETDLTKKRNLEVALRVAIGNIDKAQKAWEFKYKKDSSVSPTFKKYTQYMHDAISSVTSSFKVFR